LDPTPQSRDLPPTDWSIEGPYYTPDTPLRSRLAASDTVGVPLTLRGRVLMPNGRPVVGAVLDVWNCDGRGDYDNKGFKLRGHQYTDADGRFIVETVKPADYAMLGGTIRRTPHVHFKVQGPNTRLLTTQLYFPDEPLNARDIVFDPKLTMSVQPTGTRGLAAEFTFVLAPPRDSSVSRG
jgi:protocatechuate 3,4-dioxygenase beta subunit